MTLATVDAADQRAGELAADTSVVICAYTERRFAALASAVASARVQSPAPREVIVVIDHNPALLARARAQLRGVAVVASVHAQGLSGARNTGVEQAAGRIVAFLDDDARAQPGWLAALVAPLCDPTVVGTGGLALPDWEEPRPGWLPEEFLWVVGCSYRGLPRREAEVRNPIGATMAFRRDALRSAGGFAHGIGRIGATPLGCEETELAIRARALTGGRIVHVPAARVGHLVAAERGRFAYFRARCVAEGRSKAAVSNSVGADAALAAERHYVRRTLPAGVLAGARDAMRGDLSGLGRSACILAGLVFTAYGYLCAVARWRLAAPR